MCTCYTYRLLELDEGIEALDAAIEYRSDTIKSRQLEVRHSQAIAKVQPLLYWFGLMC